MNAEEFSQRVELARAQVRRLQDQGQVQPSDLRKLLRVLEELQVAQDQLRLQAEEGGADRQLQAEPRRYRELFEGAPGAYLVTDPTGVIREANQSAGRLLGAEPRFLAGKALAAFVAAEDRSRFRACLRRLEPDREIRTLPLHLALSTDGGTQVLASLSAIAARGQGISEIRWLIREVADLRRPEQTGRRTAKESPARSRQVQKLESIGLLAGGIAHDFNNLLHVILGNTDIALGRLSSGSSAREPLDEVVRATLRAGALTKQLLAYVGKSEPVVEQVDLSREAQDMATLLRTALSKQATLVWDLATGLPPVSADPTQLRQVVMNLITNASEALGDQPGQIVLRTARVEEDSGYVFLEVSDTGQGMSPDTVRRIFDPFFTTKTSGRGLGLATVLGIVDAHGGRVRIRTAPGEGSTFRVLLPAASGELESATQDSSRAAGWRGHGTILVAEDEEGVREVATRMLASVGFEVLAAADGREAVGMLARHIGDVVAVLLDLSMPRMGGREAFRLIRERWPELPVVLMSGYTEQAVPRFDDPRAGPTRFLQKPFTPDDLVGALQEVLPVPGHAGAAEGL